MKILKLKELSKLNENLNEGKVKNIVLMIFKIGL